MRKWQRPCSCSITTEQIAAGCGPTGRCLEHFRPPRLDVRWSGGDVSLPWRNGTGQDRELGLAREGKQQTTQKRTQPTMRACQNDPALLLEIERGWDEMRGSSFASTRNSLTPACHRLLCSSFLMFLPRVVGTLSGSTFVGCVCLQDYDLGLGAVSLGRCGVTSRTK